MFNRIAPRYDLLNRLLSAGIDVRWRKKLVSEIKASQPKTILDAATGTGDLAFELLKLKPKKINAIDISTGMIQYGIKKKTKYDPENIIQFSQGDCEQLLMDNDSFDAITIAFGVRNFQNLDKGLQEFHRVLIKGGILAILEFAKPANKTFNFFYKKYSKHILPAIGKMISKDTRAYTYLPESVEAFPYGKEFENIVLKNNFSSVKTMPLSFGIANLYLCRK